MKRALLVGIDEYDFVNDLAGCVNDVQAIAPLLARNEDGNVNFQCQTRTSAGERVTRASLLADLDGLLGTTADLALLYFAGHGDPVGGDVALVTQDATAATPGVTMAEVMTKIRNSPVGEVVILLDCCFSGAAGAIPQLGAEVASLRDGVSILTASRAEEGAAETEAGRGAFSTYLEGALAGGAADTLGKVTVAGLYAYLDEAFGAWDQRPLFKANVSRLVPIREAEPPIDRASLRKLKEWFPQPDFDFPLDPSYEPEADPDHPEHEAIFHGLQKLRAARLLVPIGEDHMYFAAMNSTGCRLTPLGRLYWQMVHEDRL
ncbi:MAG: caspase family protein [Actinobacteria bacterium]|nr:caspase family protein [Actinomycetota bacterium]